MHLILEMIKWGHNDDDIITEMEKAIKIAQMGSSAQDGENEQYLS